MKIVCEACAAKYSISDDKVRGKVFKIRCKKCSHIIVVRGDADQAAEEAPQAESHAGQQMPAGSDAVWYVVVEGEQVGPLTEADVSTRIARTEISGETFAWREGMADWIQVSAIAEFSNALSAASAGGGFEDADSPFAPQPTAVYPPGTAESMFGDDDATPSPAASNGAQKRSEATEVFGAPGALSHAPAGQDLFAPQAGGADPFASVAAHAAPSSHGASGGGGGFFNVPAAAAPASSSGGGGAGLTAQRSENSVLFSLSNLEALAAPSPSASPGFGAFSASGNAGYGSSPAAASPSPASEGSGLIDIRSMAAMTLGNKPGSSPFGGGLGRPPTASELPTFSAAPLAPMSPMLMPARAGGGIPTYVWGLVGLVVVLLVGFTFVILKTPPAAVVAPATAPEPVATAPAAAVPPSTPPAPTETPPATVDEPLPPREQAAAPVNSDKGSGSKRPSSSGKKPSSGTASPKPAAEEAPVVAAPKPAPAPEAAAPKKGSLDDLLAGAIGGTPKKPSGPSASPTPTAAEPAKKLGPLSKSDIVKGMMSIAPKTSACYQQYKVPGTANVNLKVGSSGKVDEAQVTGKFAGTPTGDCVEKAVKTAKFPPSDGLNFPYPVPLR